MQKPFLPAKSASREKARQIRGKGALNIHLQISQSNSPNKGTTHNDVIQKSYESLGVIGVNQPKAYTSSQVNQTHHVTNRSISNQKDRNLSRDQINDDIPCIGDPRREETMKETSMHSQLMSELQKFGR